MNNNAKKDAYDKLMGYGEGELFSINGFDEMQKLKNYEIGFKLFRAFFWIIYIVSMAIVLVGAAFENLLFSLIGLGVLFLCTAFHIIYSSKAAAAGVINPKFAKGMAKKSVLISGIMMLSVWIIMLLICKVQIEVVGIWLNLGCLYIGNYFCARKNMKVLEKMLKDESEEE